ncbi:hypothetical protein [Natrialba sp. PRR66]|uniref:hypothetical protein n=1 Tax=Natrialba sp. PRR66 TaxID=3098146 RepID=UPI002B1E3BDF|nr:hypothetical protein [Natrialba sp. PRR66]
MLQRVREFIEIAGSFCQSERVEYDRPFFDLSGFAIDAGEHASPTIYVAAMGNLDR